MRRSREQMRKELMAEAESAIDEFLTWREGSAPPTLTEVEDIVLKLRGQLGKRMVEILAEGEEATQPAEAPLCPQCRGRLRYRGQKGVTVESRAGTLRVQRGYYHCQQCGSGFFPLG